MTILHVDEDGDPATCEFNYASVIGMIWYLYGHSRSELDVALSQASRFAHSPCCSQELAFTRISQYLKGTHSEGMILKSTKFDRLFMNCYVDADFLSLHEKPNVTILFLSSPGLDSSSESIIALLSGLPSCRTRLHEAR